MKYRVVILALTLLTTGCSSEPSPGIVWPGSYEYVDYGGRTSAGTPIVVTYRLEVPPKKILQPVLRITGFQVDQELWCDVPATAQEMSVKFRSYRGGELTNEFGVAVYQPGQVLFTLQLQGGARDLVTTWQALKPAGARESSGRFFAKVGAAPE